MNNIRTKCTDICMRLNILVQSAQQTNRRSTVLGDFGYKLSPFLTTSDLWVKGDHRSIGNDMKTECCMSRLTKPKQ